jgi:hypothetical protein
MLPYPVSSEVVMPLRKDFSIDTRTIPARSGVYLVYDDATLEVLDVGESKTVGRRIRTHERRSCWTARAQGDVRVGVVWTPHAKKRGRRIIEEQLRESLDPPCGQR